MNSRRSSATESRARASTPSSSGLERVCIPISAPRTAFISASSTLWPMAIASPVAFICVPSRREAFTNLSNGHFGSLTTM